MCDVDSGEWVADVTNCAVCESKCLGKADVAAVPSYVDVLVVVDTG